jgi:crotonobetainyl-CoA:carnitine CoA-transferase CaiB-like acyl-CoA transferase
VHPGPTTTLVRSRTRTPSAVGRNEVLSDKRFATVVARARNVKEWFAVRGAALSSKSTAEWLAIFQAVDIAAMPVHSLETLRRDEHLVAVDLVKMEDHPTEGRVAAIRSTIRIDDEYPPRLSPAQPRGSETRVLLHEVGLSAREIDDLISSGAAIVQQK